MTRFRPFFMSVLTCCALLACTVTAFAADSGSTALPKLSKIEIIDLLQNYPLDEPINYYEQEPSLTAPHTTGVVRQEILDSGLNQVNVARRLAGLPPVSLSDTLNDYAQKGSVVMAAGGGFSHYPVQPEGMDDDFYRDGYHGTSHANIFSWMIGAIPHLLEDPISASIDSYMADSDRYNVDRLGHRRWLLKPTLQQIGLGVAHAFADGYTQVYSATYVQGPSGGYVPYDFISWPASGLFPNTHFIINENPTYWWYAQSDAWSVALNPTKYSRPSLSGVEVTLTEQATGRSWVFNAEQEYSLSDCGLYFNVNNGGYGEGWTIIFRPAEIDGYEGVYTVSITGLKTRGGQDATLEYSVEFFTPTCLDGHTYQAQTVPPTCTQPGTEANTCSVCGKEESPVELPALGHDYERNAVEVSCETPGSVTDICSRCGDEVLISSEDALGHAWSPAPIRLDDSCHAVLCTRDDCGAQKDSAAHEMSFLVADDLLPYSACSGCEHRRAALEVSENGDTITVKLDYVPQPLWVMAARYDDQHRLLAVGLEKFTQPDSRAFPIPAGKDTRLFFLTEQFVPFYVVK